MIILLQVESRLVLMDFFIWSLYWGRFVGRPVCLGAKAFEREEMRKAFNRNYLVTAKSSKE